MSAPDGAAAFVRATRVGDVRAPAETLRGERGGGFAAAQPRLGRARLRQAIRWIGPAGMPIDRIKARVHARGAFGRALAEFDTAAIGIARARIDVEMHRPFVHRAAARLDEAGVEADWRELSMTGVTVPRMLRPIADRAMRTFGAAGAAADRRRRLRDR